MFESLLNAPTPPLAYMLGVPEIIVIGVVALLLFGKRLPEVARSAGKAVVSFKKGLRDVEQDIEDASDEDERSNVVRHDSGSNAGDDRDRA